MLDYKNTLNLPTTDFSMKANLAQREPERLQNWKAKKLYAARRAARQGAESYILLDGPPYANGNIHIGHAVNKTLKDIVLRAKFLSGFDTPYVPGWDCHGLPIEVNVEKKIGKPGPKLSAKQFRQACREYAASQVEGQSADFQRLGIMGDWEHPYRTMDFNYEANIVRALKDIVAKGYIAPGFKPIHWCFDCQSSLADAEVEYQDKISPSIDVKFPVADPTTFLANFNVKELGQGEVSVVIWTTTPWTLLANYGVALHPELTYDLVQAGAERWVVAHDLVESVMQRCGIADYTILANTTGKNLDRQLLQHPFIDRTSLIILGEHVTTDAGTGAVHTAPAHGEDDFIAGKAYDLPVLSPVQADGVFAADTPYVGGQFVFKANKAIIELLTEKQALAKASELHHSYPHCWRHKTPLVFRATPQWFIRMNELAEQATNELSGIKWLPIWGRERMANMLRDRPDWCISRQRAWGAPMPFFMHKTTQALHPRTVELMEIVAKKIEEAGIDAWFDCDKAELLGVDADDYVKCTDVIEVWFESGVAHYCLHQSKADLYLEGSDQYRGWFQSSLLSSMALQHTPPYKQLVTHGFVVDGQGRKMSKSIGNVILPEKVIQQYGADVLRLWVASTDFTGEMSVSDDILKRTSETYRRIRNTARFLLSNLHDFDPAQHLVADKDLLAIDRWMLYKTAQSQTAIMADYEQFDFHHVVQKIHHFCSIELGSLYLDVVKDRQYTGKTEGIPRRSAQTAMYHMLEALVRWVSPILCFTADEIWEYMPGKRGESVHLESWYSLSIGKPVIEFDDQFWASMLQLRDEVNKAIEQARGQNLIGSALEANVTIYAPLETIKSLEKLGDELRFLLITSVANFNIADTPRIDVSATNAEKCERCWHRVELTTEPNYPGICPRCVENIAGKGETRKYV